MTKTALIIIGGLLATGCASSQQGTQTACLTPQATPPAAVAMALAFNPAVASPTPILARDTRELSATGGFGDAVVEIYDVQTDDDQVYSNGLSTYERRVLSDRTGALYH